MSLISRIRLSSLVLSIIFVFSISANAQQKELPHFFPEGVKQTNVPAKQWQEWKRYQNAANQALADPHGDWPGFIEGSDTVVLNRTYFGQNTKLVFNNHICEGKMNGQSCSGKIRYTSFESQKYITQHEFDVVVAMTDEFVDKAVKFNYAFWGDVEELAVSGAAQGEGKSVEEFRKTLDKEDPHNPGITFRELRQIPPKLQEKDFVPFREIHIGLTPAYTNVLGVAYLNSGVVYYTPMAMIRDYLTMSTPLVLAHEFVHTNKKLQGMPIVWGFDAETMASIPDMLDENDHLDLAFHGYAYMFREFAEVFFSFKFEQAFDEIVKRDYDMTMGNLVIDEDKFNKYSAMLNVIKAEFKVAFKRAITEFYKDRIFWTAMNDKTLDDNFVFRVMMASMYNMTLLGGEAATTKFNEAHKAEIKAMIDKAWQETGSSSDENSDEAMLLVDKSRHDERIPQVLLRGVQQRYGVSDEQIQRFLKVNKISSISQLFNWEPVKLRKAIEDFMIQERKTRRVQ